MECTRTEQHGATVIRLRGRFDIMAGPEFDQQCQAWLQPDVAEVILDLAELDFISSAGLRSVVSLNKKLKARQGQLILCNLKGVVSEVFAVSGLSFVLPIFNSVEEAILTRQNA